MSLVTTDLWARAIHYVSDTHTNHVLSRSNGYEGRRHKPPTAVRVLLQDISGLPRYSNYLFLEGNDSTGVTHGKVPSLTRLYVPIINRPYSVVGPTNVATDRLGITDASFFNETIRASNPFGPRARGWKCASSSAADIAVCICPALLFRRYLKQKGGDTKSLLDYLKSTSSDSLLCFKTATMELTHFLPLASLNEIGPCSDVSAVPFEIATTYLYSFMDLAPNLASNKSAQTFPPGTFAALLTCCDSRIYLVIVKDYKIKHIQLFTVLQPVPNLFASSITALSIQLLTRSNSNSEVPRLLLLASGPLALASPQPAIVSFLSGVKANTRPPPVICAYIVQFSMDTRAMPQVTTSVSLFASSFMDLLNVSTQKGKSSMAQIPTSLRIVKNGKGPEIIMAGHYRLFLKPLYLRRNGPTTTKIARDIAKSATVDASGISVVATTDTKSAASDITGSLIPHRDELINVFVRNLWYFRRSFEEMPSYCKTPLLFDPRALAVSVRFLLIDWLLLIAYIIGLFAYTFYGILTKVFASIDKSNIKFNKREARGSYAVPICVQPLLFNRHSTVYHFLIFLSDESVIGAKTVSFFFDQNTNIKKADIKLLQLYLIDSSTLQLPKNTHITKLSTRPILLYNEFKITICPENLPGYVCPKLLYINSDSRDIPPTQDQSSSEISEKISRTIRYSNENLHESIGDFGYRKSHTLLDQATEQLNIKASSSYLYYSSARRSSLHRTSSSVLSLHSTGMDSMVGVVDAFTSTAPLLYLCTFSYSSNTFQLNMYTVDNGISCCYSLPVSLDAIENTLNNIDTIPSFINTVDYLALYQSGNFAEIVSQLVPLDNKKVSSSAVAFHDTCTDDTGDSDVDPTPRQSVDAIVLSQTETSRLRRTLRTRRSQRIDQPLVICAGVCSRQSREDTMRGIGSYLIDYCDMRSTSSKNTSSECLSPEKMNHHSSQERSQSNVYKVIHLPVVREDAALSFSFTGSVTKTKSALLPNNSGVYGCTSIEVLFSTKQSNRVSELVSLALTERTIFEYRSGTAFPRAEMFSSKPGSFGSTHAPGAIIKKVIDLMGRYIRNGKLLVQAHGDTFNLSASQRTLPKLDTSNIELALLSMLQTIATRDMSEFYRDFSTDSSSALNGPALEVMITWFAKGSVVAFNILQKTSILDLIASYRQFLALLYCIVRRTCRFICDTLVLSYRRTVALHQFLSLVELMSVQVGLTKLLETCYKKSIVSILETVTLSAGFRDDVLYEVEKLIKAENSFIQYYDVHRLSNATPFFISYNSLLHYVRDLIGKDYSFPDSYEEPNLRKGTPEYLQHTNATSLFLATCLLSDITGHDAPCLPGFLISYLHLYLCPQQYNDANDINIAIYQRLKNKIEPSAGELAKIITNAVIYRTLSQFINTLITSKDMFISFDSFPDYLVSHNMNEMILLLKLWPLSRYMGYDTNSSSNLMRHLLTLNTATSILQKARNLSDFILRQSSPDIDEQHIQLQKAFEDSVAHASSFACRELADSLICAAFSSPTYTALLRQLSSKVDAQATSADDRGPQRSSIDVTDCWADDDQDNDNAVQCHAYAQAVKCSHKSDEIILASPTLSAFLDRETVHLSNDNAMLQKALIEQLEFSGRYIGFFTSLYYFVGYSFRFDDFLSTDQQISFVSTPILGRCTPVPTLLKTTVLEEDAQAQITNAIQLSNVIVKCLTPRIERAIHEANEYTRMYLSDLIDIRIKDGYVDGISILMRTILNITELPLNDVSNKDMLRIAHIDAHFRMYELFKQALENPVIAKPLLLNIQTECKQRDILMAISTPSLFAWKEFCVLPLSAIIFTALACFSILNQSIATNQSVTWLGHYYASVFASSFLSYTRQPTIDKGSTDPAEFLQHHVPEALVIGDEIPNSVDAILLSCVNSQTCDDVFKEAVLVTILHGILQTPYAIQALVSQYCYIKLMVNIECPSRLQLDRLFDVLVGRTENQLFSKKEDCLPTIPPLWPLYTHCGLGSHFSYDSFKPLVALIYMVVLSEEDIAKLTHDEQKDLYRYLIDCILTPSVRKSSTMIERIESIVSVQNMLASGIVMSPISHLKLRVIQSLDKYTDVYRRMCSSFISGNMNVDISEELEEKIRKMLALTESGEMFDGVDGPGVLIEYAIQFKAKTLLTILGTRFDMVTVILEALCHHLQETYDKEFDLYTSSTTNEHRVGAVRLTNSDSYKIVKEVATFSYELLDNISLEGSTHANALLRKQAASSAFKGLAAQLLFFIDADIMHTKVSLLLTSMKGTSNTLDSLSSDLDPEVTKDLGTALLGGDAIGRSIVSDWIDVYRMGFNYYWRQKNNALAFTGVAYYPSCVSRILSSSVCLLSTKRPTGTDKRSPSDYESFLLYLLLTTAFFYIPIPASLKLTQSDTILSNNSGIYEKILLYSSTNPLPVMYNEQQAETTTFTNVARNIINRGSQSSSLYSSLRDLHTSKRRCIYSHRNKFVAEMYGDDDSHKKDVASACTLSTLMTCYYVSLFLEYIHRKPSIEVGVLPVPGDGMYKDLLMVVSTAPISNICDKKSPLHYMGIPIPLLAQLKLPFIDNFMIRLTRESWASEPIAAFLYLSLSNSERLVTNLFLPNSASYTQELSGMTLLSFAIRLLGLEISRSSIFRYPMTTETIRRLLINTYTNQRSSQKGAASFLSLRDLSDDSQTEYFHGMPYHVLLLPSQIPWSNIIKATRHAIAASVSIFPDNYANDRLYRQTVEGVISRANDMLCLLPVALTELSELINDPCYQSQDTQSTVLSLLRDLLSALLSVCHGLLSPGVFYTAVAITLYIFGEKSSPTVSVSDVLAELREFSNNYLLINYILRKYCSQSGESLEVLLSFLSEFVPTLSFSENSQAAQRLVDAFASNIVHGDPSDHMYPQKIYSLYTMFASPNKHDKKEFLQEVLKKLPACRKSWFVPWFTNKAIVPALDLPHDQVHEIVRLAYTQNILSDSDPSTSSSLLAYLDLSSTVDISRIVSNTLTESPVVTKATNMLSAVQNFVTVSKIDSAGNLSAISQAYCDILKGISWDITSLDDVGVLSSVLENLTNVLLEIIPDMAKPYVSAVLAGDSVSFIASLPVEYNLTAVSTSSTIRRSLWKNEDNSNRSSHASAASKPVKLSNAWNTESDSDSIDDMPIVEKKDPVLLKVPKSDSQQSKTPIKTGWDCDTDTTDDCEKAKPDNNCWATDLTDTDYEAWSSDDEVPQSEDAAESFSSRAVYNVQQPGQQSIADTSCRQTYIPIDAIDHCAAMIKQAVQLRKVANHYVSLTKEYCFRLFKGLFTSLDSGIPLTARFALLNLDHEGAIMILKDFIIYVFAGEKACLTVPNLVSLEAKAFISSLNPYEQHLLSSFEVYAALNASLILNHISEIILSSHVLCHELPSYIPVFREDTVEFLRWVYIHASEIGIDNTFPIVHYIHVILGKDPDLALPLAYLFLCDLKSHCLEDMKYILISDTVSELCLKDSELVSSWLTVIALCLSSALSKTDPSNIARLAMIQDLTSETTEITSKHQLEAHATLQLLSKLHRILAQLSRKFILDKLNNHVGILDNLSNLSEDYLNNNREILLLYIKLRYMSDAVLLEHKLSALAYKITPIPVSSKDGICFLQPTSDDFSNDDYLQRSLIAVSAAFSLSPSITSQSQDTLLEFALRMIALDLVRSPIQLSSAQYILFWEAAEALLSKQCSSSSFRKLLPKLEEDSSNRDKLLLFYTTFYTTTLADINEYRDQVHDKLERLLQLTAILSKPMIIPKTLCVLLEPNQYLENQVTLPLVSLLGIGARGKDLLARMRGTEFVDTINTLMMIEEDVYKLNLYGPSAQIGDVLPREMDSMRTGLLRVYTGISNSEVGARLAEKLGLTFVSDFRPLAILRTIASKVM